MIRAWRTTSAATAVVLCCAAVTAARDGQSPVQRADALLAKMSLNEKLDLVASGGAGDVRLGIPPLSGVDGPNGVGEGTAGVTAFPDAVAIGASWNPQLARRYGIALGAETAGTGHTLLFAPTVNTVRTPLWGREAETFGEDPFLTGQLAASEIRGIQSQHVIAEVKHFAAYNQETGRFGPLLAQPAVNVLVSVRALREIYFPAFQAAVGPGGAGSVMCSYNRIDGTPSCQDPATLGALRGFGLRGFVEPDAKLAVRDVVAAINSGVDNFQLGSLLSAAGGAGGVSGGPERAALANALAAGEVSPARIDDAVRRILIGMLRVGLIGRPRPPVTAMASIPAHRALATAISAQGTVLLRNRAGVLPLTRRSHSIAVIGFDAGADTQIEENGSPAVLSSVPVITPLAAIRARAGRRVRVSYAAGTRGVVALPVVPASALTPSSGSGHGLSGTFYASGDFSGSPISTRIDPTLDFAGRRAPLQPIPGTRASSARWTGTLNPPRTGTYRFSLAMSGTARLFVAGRLVTAGNTEFITGAPQYPGANPVSYQGMIRLTARRKVPIRIEYSTGVSIAGAELHLGWEPPEPGLLAHAVAAARQAKVAVVFANDVSSEGMDRPSLQLPGDQNRLIAAVAAANPRTIVVLHTAGPVLMPFRSKVAAILEAWYPGQQSGRAIAETLFGDVDPSGRLPVTFPASARQGPAASAKAAAFPGSGDTVRYREGIFVGYRFYDRFGQEPRYPFGYGLSYTTFSLAQLKVRALAADKFDVSVRVRNTGPRPGAEAVELYVGDPTSTGEPPRQLKAFASVFLERGQSRTVVLGLDASSFAHYEPPHKRWGLTSGRYHIYLGASSRDLPLRATIAVRT